MASNIRFTTTTLNGFLDTINTRLGAGALLRIYDGTQPTNADTALGAQVKLAELALSATPFAAAGSHQIVANAITSAAAVATGTAAWGTLTTSAGVRVMDFSVGTAGADLNFDSVAFASGATIAVTSLSLSLSL